MIASSFCVAMAARMPRTALSTSVSVPLAWKGFHDHCCEHPAELFKDLAVEVEPVDGDCSRSEFLSAATWASMVELSTSVWFCVEMPETKETRLPALMKDCVAAPPRRTEAREWRGGDGLREIRYFEQAMKD